jgi:nitrogenase molybdenum-iron protein alpha chain
MSLELESPVSQTREQRLGSITGYKGDLTELVQSGCSGGLKNRSRCLTTASSCSHGPAIGQLSGIEGVVVIDHSPIGCTAGQTGAQNLRGRAPTDPDVKIRQRHIISTGMTESDTVFGGTETLRATIRTAFERHKPRAIFIVTSCVSSIIGDDVDSVAREASEELGIPVGTASAEGLRSKIWASGFDAYCHTVSRTLVQAPIKSRNDLINYVGFVKVGRKKIDPLFARIGLEVNYLTANSTLEDFARASEALGTFIQCGSAASYLAGALEQLHGVKFFQTYPPYGGLGFERFFRQLGAYVGKEKEAEEVIAEQRELYASRLAELRKELAGTTALIALGGTYAFEYLRMLGELGIKVLHTAAFHFDPKLDNQSEDPISFAADILELGLRSDVSVNDIQQYEIYLAVKKFKPDFVISRAHGTSPWAVRTGVVAVEAQIGIQIFGYQGLVNLGRTIALELRNRNFSQKLARHFKSPFTEAFEASDPFAKLLPEA